MRAQPHVLLSLAWASPSLAFRANTGLSALQPSLAHQRGISLRRFSGTSSNEMPQGPATVPWLPPLKNRYFALRHGQSTANVEGVISSLPALGIASHGLTPLGVEQARSAAPQILESIGDSADLSRLVVYASDFTRARETAEEAQSALRSLAGSDTIASLEVKLLPELRERWFGDLDAKDVSTYNDVWPLDLEDAHHTNYGVESVQSVAQRLRGMFLHLEEEHAPGTPILLTSHADTLQIMQCLVAKADLRFFSQYRFGNGEVRALGESPDTLPEPKPLSKDVSRM